MKNLQAYFYALLLVFMTTLSSCDVVGDIFKAGMWASLIIIVLIVFLVIWLFRKIFKR